MIDIGQRIKQLRVKNNLTLEELASRTELTKGFLSQLERNLTAPSLTTLEDIAEALGTNMSKFFADEKEEKIVFTPDDAFIDEKDGRTVHWIVPNSQKNEMEPVILEVEAGASSKDIGPHDGEELGYVLNGRLVLVTETNRKGLSLKKGDTFYIKGDEAHHLENRSKKNASILWISTPPKF